jgi:hypothetical protein
MDVLIAFQLTRVTPHQEQDNEASLDAPADLSQVEHIKFIEAKVYVKKK